MKQVPLWRLYIIYIYTGGAGDTRIGIALELIIALVKLTCARAFYEMEEKKKKKRIKIKGGARRDGGVGRFGGGAVMGVSSGGVNGRGARRRRRRRRYRVFPRRRRAPPGGSRRVTGGRDRACELVRGGQVGSQWQRTGRPGCRDDGGGEERRQQHRRRAVVHARRCRGAAHRSPVGSTNLTRWPAGQFTPIWDRGRQVSERSKIRKTIVVAVPVVLLSPSFFDRGNHFCYNITFIIILS